MFTHSSSEEVAGTVLSATAGLQLVSSRISFRAIAAMASAIAFASCATSPPSDLDRVSLSESGVVTPSPDLAGPTVLIPRERMSRFDQEEDYLTVRLRDLPWD
jgi:hypothetical protein